MPGTVRGHELGDQGVVVDPGHRLDQLVLTPVVQELGHGTATASLVDEEEALSSRPVSPPTEVAALAVLAQHADRLHAGAPCLRIQGGRSGEELLDHTPIMVLEERASFFEPHEVEGIERRHLLGRESGREGQEKCGLQHDLVLVCGGNAGVTSKTFNSHANHKSLARKPPWPSHGLRTTP